MPTGQCDGSILSIEILFQETLVDKHQAQGIPSALALV